jgi:formamidopyrimidine-DNA glycosylase
MPEGVEVKLSAEVIKPLVKDKRVLSVSLGANSRYKSQPPEGLNKFIEATCAEIIKVNDVQTKGKFMYWTLSHDWHMFCTFGMSGQWSPNKGKHPCLGIFLGENHLTHPVENIYFNDPRHFGTIKFTNNPKDLTDKIKELGWDPLQMLLSNNLPWITARLARTKKPIAEVLMDQKIFAGVGNYIKCEGLYRAKLSPWRASPSLNNAEIQLLCQSIVDVMNESYQHQGATIQTYKTVYGEEGRYSTLFRVYGKKVDPNGNKIISEITPDKRNTHWCPIIQK